MQDAEQLLLQQQQQALSLPVRPLPPDQIAAIDILMGLPAQPRQTAHCGSTVTDIAFVPFSDGRIDILNGLFDPIELATLDQNSVIIIRTAGRQDSPPWYSFDIKGGSFLARPSGGMAADAQLDANLLPLAGNTEGLPQWDHVDACFDGSDGKKYLFNNAKMVYAVLGDPNGAAH